MTVAWVFPGQGSQVVGMGRDLYASVPAARAVFDEADQVLDINVSRLCFEGPETTLTATENTQPALLTASVAVMQALKTMLPAEMNGHAPMMVAGHSLGEYSALVAGGALDLETAVRLVRRRGELMAAANEGKMAAVIGLDEQALDELCTSVTDQCGEPVVVANYNAPGQLVVSGATPAVEQVCAVAKERGAKRAIPLKVSAAFHSPLMTHAAEKMSEALAAATVSNVQIPLVANVTGTALHLADDIRHELVAQVASPVRWIDSIRHMVEQGVSTFVEIGPGTVLTGLIKRIAPGTRLVNLQTAEDIESFVAESC